MTTVKCDGCGKDSGNEIDESKENPRTRAKPQLWYARRDSDGEQIACSRDCIDLIAKNTNKTRVILPW